MAVEKTIETLLHNNAKIETAQYDPEARFVEDLGMDSLDIAELVVGLEKEYRIVIPDDDLNSFKTVSDACIYVEERLTEENDQ